MLGQQTAKSKNAMKRRPKRVRERDTMRDHYDFTGGARGKYAARYAESRIVIVVDGDIPRDVDGNAIARLTPRRSANKKKRSPSRKPGRRKG